MSFEVLNISISNLYFVNSSVNKYRVLIWLQNVISTKIKEKVLIRSIFAILTYWFTSKIVFWQAELTDKVKKILIFLMKSFFSKNKILWVYPNWFRNCSGISISKWFHWTPNISKSIRWNERHFHSDILKNGIFSFSINNFIERRFSHIGATKTWDHLFHNFFKWNTL